MAESDTYRLRDKRPVWYTTLGGVDGGGNYTEWKSVTEVICSGYLSSRIENPDLRCALRLADIAQALGLLDTPEIPAPSSTARYVTAVVERPATSCVGYWFPNGRFGKVLDELPDDVMEQIKAAHTREDNSSLDSSS